jgi:hypothetical protein
MLRSDEAYETAYRFIARYYDHVRTEPILKLLEAFSSTTDHPAFNDEPSLVWKACVEETLEGAPLPALPPPWDW